MAGANRGPQSTAPAYDAVLVTPSDATIIPATRGLYVGTAGNLTVTMADGSATSVLFTNVPVGFAPLQVTKVWSTGTAASGIVALY